MTENKLKALVTEAVALDRELADKTDKLKTLKAALVLEAESRCDEHTATDGGGASWTAEGQDGSIARITFPGPKLKSSIKGEGKAGEKVKTLAGRFFTRLFVPAVAYKPVENFRTEAEALLGKDAKKLIRAIESESSPAVAFETKEAA